MSTTDTAEYGDRRSQNDDGGTYPYNGKVLLAAVVLLSVVVIFMILLHIYARWFLTRRPDTAYVVSQPFQSLAGLRAPGVDDVPPLFSKGLDAKIVASLPMFVHGPTESAGSPDCVVCLSAMEEGEIGRVLPRCKHAFHVECIDMWLMSHSTCPICRDRVAGEEASLANDDVAAVHVAVAVRDEWRDDDQMGGGSSPLPLSPLSSSPSGLSSSSPSSSCSSSSSSLSSLPPFLLL